MREFLLVGLISAIISATSTVVLSMIQAKKRRGDIKKNNTDITIQL